MIDTIAIGTIALGAYILIHNEMLLHNNKLTKNFSVIAWRCFAGGLMIAVGLAVVLT